MGGIGDKTHRSSSPLKRPASELEEDSTILANGDVDMVNAPEASANMSAKRSNTSPPLAAIANMGTKNDIKNDTKATKGVDLDEDEDDGMEFWEEASTPATAMPEDCNQKVAAQNIDSKKVDTPDAGVSQPAPPIDEQIRIISRLVGEFETESLKEGTRAYVVSNKWLDRVKAHGTGAKVSAEVAESAIGPVNNSDIIWEVLTDQNNQPFARLNPDAVDHVKFFPEKAWDLVTTWYGLKADEPAIVRKAVDTSLSSEPNIQFETHPVVLRIHRLWAATSPIPIDQLTKAQKPAPKNWVVSRNDKVKPFLENIKRATGVKSDCAVKMWTVPEVLQTSSTGGDSTTPSRTNTPVPEQIDWSQMLVDANAFVTLPLGPMGREKVDHDDPAGNPNHSGGNSSTMDMKGLSQDCRIVLDENVEGRIYLSTFVKSVKNGSKNAALSAAARGTSSALTKTTESGRSSPAPAPPPIRMSLRGHSTGKTIGCVGLSNLGNTCYMNSALQCIRSVEELTKYFLAGEAAEEINYENPLGKNGQIAIVYNELLKEMYKSPCPGAFTPRRFKGTIGRYFPNFSGYGQQDSQEFLGLLLDALQEDLNRIKKKPYIEKPDSTDEMVNDPEALKKMADEVWSITKRRDDSVISDLFTGMYKSTLVCPECDKVSITFDPFNTVTVQIPIESTWTHTIHYFPLNGKPFKIDIDMDKNGSFKKLKQFISSRTGVPTDRLFIAEEWKGSIYRYFEDSKTASEEITNGDIILIYELDMVPTNWPPVKKQKKVRSMLNINDSEDDVPVWDAPEADRMIVPVFFRRKGSQPRYGKARAWEQALVPMMIMVTKEESRRLEVIRRKVLQRVQNLTTWEIRPDGEDSASPPGASEESADQDMLVTTASDASSGDRNVAANSVSGDEELVDITMKDPSAPASPKCSADTKKTKLPGQTPSPRWLDPSVPLTPYEECFNIAFWKDDKHLLPHGINAISLDRDYPSILERVCKQEPQEILEVEEPMTAVGDDRHTIGSPVSEEDSDVVQLGESVTRMNDESSEDDDLSAKKTLPLRTRKSPNVGSISASPFHRIVKRPLKTYSRKKSNDKSATLSHHFGGDGSYESEVDVVEQEPVIRLGEALIVDWDEEAISIMFGGEEGQGSETWKQCPTLNDPQLMAKQAHRTRRKKNGVSLSECLDEFGKEEILGDNDMWYCNRCKIHRHASKKLELWKTPDILVLHFKRFSSTSHRRDKLDVRIDFPIEGLDMTKRIVESDGKEEVYDLFAVDNHYGSLGGGHYTACAKSFVDGEWYDYNDSSVSKIRDTDNLVSSAAYLLFYRRRSKKPLGGPKLEEIVEHMRRQDDEGDEEADRDDEGGEQGNGQRLGVDSPSQNGSSSALRGVGATVPVSQRGGLLSPTTSPSATSLLGGLNGGMGRVLGTAMRKNNVPSGLDLSPKKVNTEHIENLPDYKEAVAYGPEVPPSLRDAQLNDGIKLSNNDAEFEDEAIDMGDAFNNASFSTGGGLGAYAASQSWGFSGLGVGEGGARTSVYDEDGGASDLVSDGVENGSNASSGRRAERFEDFENAEVDEDYEEASYVPDLDDSGAAGSVGLFDLSNDIVNQKLARVSRATPGGIGAYEDNLELEIPMEGKEDDEPDAMEIHVEEGEGLGKL